MINEVSMPLQSLLSIANKVKRDPLYNYCMPGLTSWLITDPSDSGCFRLLEATREIKEWITPHNHRFDLRSTVLAGAVENIVYTPHSQGDKWAMSDLNYNGNAGSYSQSSCKILTYETTARRHEAGDTYTMLDHVIHRITFEKGAIVLISEGPKKRELSQILQPYVNHQVLDTFSVPPWMFER